MSIEEQVAAFVEAALVPQDHRDGTLELADAILGREPSIADANLVTASMLGELATAERILRDDPGAASRRDGPRGWEPLLYLCFSRYLRLDDARAARMTRIARRLLDHGADPNAYWVEPSDTTGNRESALYGAVGVANRPELARLLLEAGADPNDGETPYHLAEFDGVPCARMVFEHGLDDTGRAVALLHKLDYDDLEGIGKLLELGADPNAMGPFGKTSLHQAVFRGWGRPVFDLLFRHGADPEIRNREGKTPYALAARAGNAVAMRALVEHGASVVLDPGDAFLAACARADDAAVEAALSERPGRVAELSPVDREAIVEAAAAGNTAGVGAMIDAGFDVDTLGRTWSEAPIHRAAMAGHLGTVKLLMERGADLTLRDRAYRSSPLGWAEHGGHADVLELLLSDERRIDLQDAVTYGRTGRVLELLGDADPDAAFGGGDRGVLLRAAAYGGHAGLVELLLERGSDPRLANREGKTAEHFAVERGHEDVTRLLREARGPTGDEPDPDAVT